MSKTLQEKIAVMQAAADGKPLQFMKGPVGKWLDCPSPSWDWARYDYRVKPAEPKKLFILSRHSALGEEYVLTFRSDDVRQEFLHKHNRYGVLWSKEEYIQVLKEG